MTVPENDKPKIIYEGPCDIGAALPIPFQYAEPEDVRLSINEIPLEFNIGYSVMGRTATLKVEVAADEKVTVYRRTPLDQQAVFPQNKRFDSLKMNESLDKVCLQQQEQNEILIRTLKVPISTNTVFNGDLPPLQANKALKVNAEASGFEYTSIDADQIAQEAIDAADRAKKSAEESEASNVAAAGQAQIATDKAQEATNVVKGFDAHAAEKQNAFDINAATLTARYDNNDLAKTNAFNKNAQDMTDGFNQNVMLKIDDFDAHAMEKEIAFDDNAAAKQALVDASAAAAKQSENNAKNSETNAKTSEINSLENARKAHIWAEGEDPDVESLGGVHSAKKWAETAGAIVGEGVIQDGTVSLKTTYSSSKLEKHFAVNEDHDSVLDCLDVLDSTINAKTTVPLSSLLAIDSDARPSHKAKGAEVYDEFGTMGIIDSVTDKEATIITKESREKVRIVDTLDIQKNGFGQYYVALTANEIRNEIIKGKIVQLSFNDVITNTGEQIYEFETFTKDNYAVFRRNVITEDKAERINIKVDYQGIVTFDPVSYKALDYKNISNCITEIPQDIKLELNNGTLTLKAGSKVYIPNGVEIFMVQNVNSDSSSKPEGSNGQYMITANRGTSTLGWRLIRNCHSGNTADDTGRGTHYYDIQLNKITAHNNSGDVQTSFPIAVVTIAGNKVTSIDQIFNGFGYIGSTVFALPNTKVLKPTGRNELGELISKEVVSKTSIYTFTSADNRTNHLALNSEGNINPCNSIYWNYSEKHNLVLGGGDISKTSGFTFCGRYDVVNGKIENFRVKQPFHAVDYNEITDLVPDKNLSNLTSIGQNIANWSSNISNCITEIPQDIKLELNNGTLTLKAGSKGYFPNGSTIVIPNDFNILSYSDRNAFIFMRHMPDNAIIAFPIDFYLCKTVSALPPQSDSWGVYFNATDNKCWFDDGNLHKYVEVSLPIARVTETTGNKYKSIDQVFNGFGYIGSTVFALPGVKGLIPNGKNEDGSLKSKEFITDKVLIATRTWNSFIPQVLYLHKGTKDVSLFLHDVYYEQKETPDNTINYWIWYNSQNNNVYEYDPNSKIIQKEDSLFVGNISDGKNITSFEIKQPFHALDYNDFENTPRIIEYKVNSDGSWYRKYSDGWLEQGGLNIAFGAGHGQTGTVTFVKPFKDNKYTVLTNVTEGGSYSAVIYVRTKNTTNFVFNKDATGTPAAAGKYDWYACGRGA